MIVRTAGVADVTTRAPIDVTDHMRLASVSKAFSGAAALALVGQGRLSIDDTIGARLPRLPQAWAAVTLGQLLNHTSGVPDYLSAPATQRAIAASLTDAPPPGKLLDFVAGDPLVFTPGSQYAYSNSDNVVVGLMVEAITRKDYRDALGDLVYRPLGLAETSLPPGPAMPRPFMHGYEVPATGPLHDLSEVLAAGWTWASGGMISTPNDLSRFIRGYVGGQLFGGATRRAQLTFVPGASSEPPGPGVNAAGLGIFRYRTPCGVVFGHTGNILGYTQFAAASRNGRRSAVVSVSTQLRPDLDGPVFAALRRLEVRAVCAALGG